MGKITRTDGLEPMDQVINRFFKIFCKKQADPEGKEKDKGWACDLLPKSYIVNRYFLAEQEMIDTLNSELEMTIAELEELSGEHSGEEGILKDVGNKKEAVEAWISSPFLKASIMVFSSLSAAIIRNSIWE